MEKLMTILKLLPAIITAIKAIEDALPQTGQGAAKLEALRQILVTADESVEALWPKIQSIVGVLVNLFNTVGAFRKA